MEIKQGYVYHIKESYFHGEALQVPSETRRLILDKVNKVFKLKENGINLIFPDVDKIEKLLLNEIYVEEIL